MAPRFIWRRLAALLIDLVIASQFATLLALPFLGNTDVIRLSDGFVASVSCDGSGGVPRETWAYVPRGEAVAAVTCRQRAFGVDNGANVLLTYDITDQGKILSRNIRVVPVDSVGQVVWPWRPDALLQVPLLVVGCGLCLWRWGKTPGMASLGLILSGTPRISSALLRQSLCLWPFCFYALVGFPGGHLGAAISATMAEMAPSTLLAISVGAFAIFLMSHVFPLIRWRGAMPWDRVIGSEVVRKRELPF